MDDGSINHIGIATRSLDEAEAVWSAFGFVPSRDDMILEQGVRIRYLVGSGGTKIELLEPLNEDSPVGRFITKNGEGVQQVAVDVDDIELSINHLKSLGFRLINDRPLVGSGGHRIAFVHPSTCGGVLIELVERKLSE
jgi:methylmalonyl-CoA epimerase